MKNKFKFKAAEFYFEEGDVHFEKSGAKWTAFVSSLPKTIRTTYHNCKETPGIIPEISEKVALKLLKRMYKEHEIGLI